MHINGIKCGQLFQLRVTICILAQYRMSQQESNGAFRNLRLWAREYFPLFSYVPLSTHRHTRTHRQTDTHTETDRHTHTQRQTDTHIETDRQTHPQMHTNTCLISLDRSTASSCDGVEPKAFLVPVHTCIPIRKAWCRWATVPCVNIHRFMGLAVNCVATLVPPFVTLTDGVNMYINHNDYAYIIIAVQLCSKLIHE